MLGGAGLGAAMLLAGLPRLARAQTIVAGELRIIGAELFYGLDPVHEFSAQYLRQVGAAEGLLRITPFGEIEPELAQSYERLDPFTWQVNLRQDVTFWSGRPVNAWTVVESLERSRALAPAAATLLRAVRIEPLDEWTVVFHSESPIPGLPLNLADRWLVIHNAESYGPQANPFDLSVADLTGFYRVVAWEPRARAVLTRNERYWGVRPRMGRLRFEEVGDPDARTLAALSGEAHVVRAIRPAAVRQIEAGRTMRVVTLPTASSTNAYLNIQKPPFDDVRVRQALAWATDREELVAVALDGHGLPNSSWLAAHPAYPEAKRMGYTRLDLARAAQLLDEAGWRLSPGSRVRTKDGVPLRFRYIWWGTGRPLAEVLQAQWARAGAQVEVEGATDYGFLQSKRAQNDWEVFVEGWGTFGDPPAVLGRHLAAGGDLNYMRFRDDQIEAWLAGFGNLFEPEERRQQALKINARQAELVPFVPLIVSTPLSAVSRNVRNYVPHFLFADYEVHPDLWVAA